jgi:hypothetical protein
MDMYASTGVIPPALNLERPLLGDVISVFNAFSSPFELSLLRALMLAAFACLMAGYRTRLAHLVSLVLVIGMNARSPAIVNGGYVAESLLVMWTAFLPMGDRFSVDALLASLRRRPEATAAELNDHRDLLPPTLAAPHRSLVAPVLLLQLAAIYALNAIQKTGDMWRDGTAVHYVLYLDRRVTPIVALVRDHLPAWLVVIATKSTVFLERLVPALLLLPLWRTWARRISLAIINLLHLGFGVAFQLGPFAWSLCVFSTLLFTQEDWDLAAATMIRRARSKNVVFDPRSGAALLACRILARLDRFELLTFAEEEGAPLGVRRGPGPAVTGSAALADVIEALPLGPAVAWIPRLPGLRDLFDAALRALAARDVSGFFGLHTVRAPAPPLEAPLVAHARVIAAGLREALVVLMLAAAVNQACVENPVVNLRYKVPRPWPLRLLSQRFFLRQGWFMFAPDPESEDGNLVVDAVTADGRRLDPFTGKPPDFTLAHPGRRRPSQAWGDYFARIHTPSWTGHRAALRAYLLRLPERTGNPGDALVSGDVYWIEEQCPRWGETRPHGYQRVKLFSFEATPAP